MSAAAGPTSAATPIILDDDDLDVMPHLEPIKPIVPQANMGSIKAFHALQKVKSYHHEDSPHSKAAAASGSKGRPSLGSALQQMTRGRLSSIGAVVHQQSRSASCVVLTAVMAVHVLTHVLYV